METREKAFRFLKIVRLGWLIPVILLLQGERPRDQLKAMTQQLLVPILALGLFLLLWQAASVRIQTKFGAVPGPKEVAGAWGHLMEDAKREKAKESEFYKRQEERNAQLKAQFPEREIKLRAYAGKDTYLKQILTSLGTVFAGFLLASAVAVPLGILCGLSPTLNTAINPLIQIFKPVSPLAWLPIVWIVVGALYSAENAWFKISFVNSAITVALCSLWPTLINTALGVASINQDYLNVARVLRLSWSKKVRKIVLPSALPLIFTGLRLSLGVGWMVLIAAEMLAQNPGLGKFVWDMFQNGSSETLSMIMVAVFTIGIIGFILDTMMMALQQLVTFESTT